MNYPTLKILLVDDDQDYALIAEELLSQIPGMHANFGWASNYESGLAAMRSHSHDVYLVDYQLGKRTGLDLLRESVREGLRATVILLTGSRGHDLDRECLQAGAADYLVKAGLDALRLGHVIRYAAERGRYRAELEASEDRYRQLFASNPMPIWIFDPASSRILDVNQAMVDTYGYSREEFLTMTVLDIRAPEDHAEFQQAVKSVPPGTQNVGVWRHLTKSRRELMMDITRSELVLEGRPVWMAMARDVTDELRLERALREKERQLREILNDVGDGILVVDAEGRVRLCNRAATGLLGQMPESIAGSNLDILPSAETGAVVTLGEGDDMHLAEISVSASHWDGKDARILALRDVTERRRNEQQMRLLERAIESSSNGVTIVDARQPDLPMIYVNPAIEHITGYWSNELLGRNCRLLQRDDRDQEELQKLRAAIVGESDCSVVLRNYRKDGTLFWNHLAIAPVRDEQNRVTHFIGILDDVTEQRRAQEELTYHTTHDLVTGLPRFILIEEYLDTAFAEAAAKGGRVIVFYVDLDRFHATNETRGRNIGDQVLRIVAERLTAVVAGSGRVAQVAGDEFAVVLVDPDGTQDQVEFGESMRARIEEPVQLGEQRIYITCSVGVSCFPDNGTSPQELLRQAEAAMMRAKREGRNTVSAFSNDQKQELEDRLSLGLRLHDAVREGQLVLHYQPQVSGLNWQILGFEALVRWQSPEMGLMPPKRFIRVAEELGLIFEIGAFVLETACRQARAWLDAGAGDFSISVNVSALQLQRPEFVEEVRAALEGWNLPARYLELELTESMMTENVERVIGTMRALKALGVQISLDDFGTGYSSLNYLRRFPIDKLKIDQYFVRDITSDAGAAGICRAIIALGHQLGMTVLAEGVETAAQVGYLRRNDCDHFQGYYFSVPVTAPKALEMLRHRYVAHEGLTQQQEARTLLLVDDEENILRALARALRRDGYRILTAMSATEGLDLLARNDVQVIISDQRMPDISGTEFLSNVKEMYPDTVRMVLSGYTDLTAVTEAINRGAIYKFLTKPWNDEDLRLQIREAFRNHEARMTALARA